MFNSKLYAILLHFDKYDQNRCRKYLQSPYFNRSEALVQLFDILVKHINTSRKREGGKVKALIKEKIWRQLMGTKRYDDVRYRKFNSDLLKLVEGFLAQQVYETSPLEKAAALMEAVAKRKIPKLTQTAIRSARRLSKQYDYRSADYYYEQYNIENKYYALAFENQRSDRSNLEDISENLDVFYIAEKLRILCAAITQTGLTTHQYDLSFIDEITQYLANRDYSSYPPVALYYQIYLMRTKTEEEEHYYKLKALLEEHSLSFPAKEAKDELYMAAQNYCIIRINRGNAKFNQELFALYNDLIDKGIIFAEDGLHPWYFKNIVFIALRCEEYDWAEHFIKDHQDKLPEVIRENSVTYSLAQVYFYQKKYPLVIQQLSTIEYEDVTYNLNSKTMLLATYYEMDEIEPLYSLMESFRAYLNRHKHDIPTGKRQRYQNLIRFTRKISRVLPGNQKELDKIKKEMQQTSGIVSAKWLREKIAELEK